MLLGRILEFLFGVLGKENVCCGQIGVASPNQLPLINGIEDLSIVNYDDERW